MHATNIRRYRVNVCCMFIIVCFFLVRQNFLLWVLSFSWARLTAYSSYSIFVFWPFLRTFLPVYFEVYTEAYINPLLRMLCYFSDISVFFFSIVSCVRLNVSHSFFFFLNFWKSLFIFFVSNILSLFIFIVSCLLLNIFHSFFTPGYWIL